MNRLRTKLSTAKDAFHTVKTLFEEHKLAFTVGTSILSAGAAWTGYCARQLHQQHVEKRLDSIEKAINVRREDLSDDDLKLLTRTGIGFRTGFATLGTVSVLTYVMGWRSGRKFTLKQIQRRQQKLKEAAAAKLNRPQSRFQSLQRIALKHLRRKRPDPAPKVEASIKPQEPKVEASIKPQEPKVEASIKPQDPKS